MKKLLFGIAFVVACGNTTTSTPPGTQDAAAGGRASPVGGAGSGGTAGKQTATAGTTGGSAGAGSGGIGTGGSTGTAPDPGTGGTAGAGNGGATSPPAGGTTGTAGSSGLAGKTGTGTGGAGPADGAAGSAAGAPGSGGKTAGSGGKVTGGASGSGGMTAAGGSTGAGGTGGGSVAPAGGSIGSSAGPPETKPTGYGQETTGAGSASVVEVSSVAAIQAAIDAYSGSGGLNLRYTGKFNFASISDPCTQHTLPAQIVEIKKKNDITLMGADGSGANFGLHIASSSSNIIIRNMVFGLLPGGDASDAISIEGMSGGFPTKIWIDHNEFYSSMATCAGAGDTAFDGLIDLKKGAENVTVSYNYIHDHHKVSLNGYTDDDTAVRHITYHHNIFDNVGSRTPLQRGGYSHVFNNYLHNISASGANIRMNGYSLIEANYFDTVKNPVTSRDSSALGFWELRNNNIASAADFTTYTITWSAASDPPSADATDWKTTATFPEALGYSYTANPVGCLKDGLPKVAGAGKGLATLKCN
jgi:pectate lyase